MKINADTKIAALLNHHPGALEAVVSISPHFKKLRNPILRKLLAGRTTIAMAAIISGCVANDFFETLKPLGFEADQSPVKKLGSEDRAPIPGFVSSLQDKDIITLDVRQMLAEGHDPLKLIQQQVKALKQRKALKVINTFEPTPLIALLKKQGFECYVDRVNNECVETIFYKPSPTAGLQLFSDTPNESDWDLVLLRFENNFQELDVRHLEMPQPMITILEALESMADGKAIYVHHKRIPVFLLNELKERQFDYRIKEVSGEDVKLLIFRK